MTPAKQLPLTPPSPPRRTTEVYRAITVTAKDERNPAKRGHLALKTYTGTPKPPRWIICHSSQAAAIGAEIEGVLVIGTGVAKDLFLLGPLEI